MATQEEAKVKEVVCALFIIGMKANYSFGCLRYMTKMNEMSDLGQKERKALMDLLNKELGARK